jgi:LPS export ABC transporter protein LptC
MAAKKNIRLFFLLVLLVTCAGWYLFGAALFKKTDLNPKREEEAASNISNDKIQTFSIFGFSESGKKKWQVEGKSADILAEAIQLSDITAHSYEDKTKVCLKADRGIFDRRSNDLVLQENVVATTDDGTKLTTDLLKWDAKGEHVDTDKKVHIERKEIEVEALGASAKPNLKIAQLKKDVKVNAKPSTIITCDGPLDIDYNNHIAHFNQNVKLDNGQVQVFADKAKGYFDPNKRVLRKVICEGSVKVIRGNNATYAETLIYIPTEGRVILSGRPKVIISSPDVLLNDIGK